MMTNVMVMRCRIGKRCWGKLILVLLTAIISASILSKAEAQIKVLSNSRHAYGSINSTINLLLGTGHVGTSIVSHSTNLNSVYTACCASAFNTSATYYDHNGTATTSSAPYQIYTSSFAVTAGDTIAQYNQYNGYDFTHNLAFTNSPNATPPVFHTAPGGGGWASKPGVEWTIDPALFCVSTLSCLTASNAGIMASLRHNHPTWNWLDVKAALRQTGTNWETGYDAADYGFGVVNFSSSTLLADNQILLQPPVASTTRNNINQISFTLYPYKQTRRVKEVLFQFNSNPGFQTDEMSLSDINNLGGTKVTEYTQTTATNTLTPIFDKLDNVYFVWFTADNNDDNVASFSRIDTYTILGPLSQNKITFNTKPVLLSPNDNNITSTTPTLSWSDAVSHFGISHYQLYIDGVLNRDNILSTSTTPSSPLSDGEHSWYILAINGDGDATTSASTRNINVLSTYDDSQFWYVDNVLGDDSNIGTQSSPWRSLSKAAATAQPGNTVFIIKNQGVPYRENLSPKSGNASSGNIVFSGVNPSTKPEIWGSDDISQVSVGDWSIYSGGNPGTYQRTMPPVGSLAIGSSINDLTPRDWTSTDQNTLSEGEWFHDGTVLYYRLQPNEDINNLHIEAGQRDYGLSCNYRNTFRDLIVRYVSYDAVTLSLGCIGERLVVSDSGNNGFSLTGNGTLADPGPTLSHSVSTRNYNAGLSLLFTSYANIYNNTIIENSLGLQIQIFAHNTNIRNNIFASNKENIKINSFTSLNNFAASNNNWYDGAIDASWINTYQGSNNLPDTIPNFVLGDSNDFRLLSTSSNIDNGSSTNSTVDIEGNPIYGSPDIGAYEYQPPYTTQNNDIPSTGTIRIYENGKYRMLVASSSQDTSPLSISPRGENRFGTYLDLSISNWDNINKSWLTTATTGSDQVTFTVNELNPNNTYEIMVDGVKNKNVSLACALSTCVPNNSGSISFTYSNQWTQHVFSLNDTGGHPVTNNSGSKTTKKDVPREQITTTPQSVPDKKSVFVTPFNTNLSLGDIHPDVIKLQQFLNTNGFTIALSGPGSAGNETNYFGSMTEAALRKFQLTHQERILSPLGLVAPTGYFGLKTREVMNSISSME